MTVANATDLAQSLAILFLGVAYFIHLLRWHR